MKQNLSFKTLLFILSIVLCSSFVGITEANGQTTPPNLTKFKLGNGNANPLLDYVYCADPTAVVYQGRVYVYGTHDQEEYNLMGNKNGNTYAHIHSLVMLSSDDMVNWTFHGTIDLNTVAPWHVNSWAPSIASRVEEDGLTHFYLYFSNSGEGVGVITSTSPVGPWSDPLGKPLISVKTPGLINSPAPFDPGVTIDENGVGWLAFGGGDNGFGDYMPGTPRIVRLGKDMVSLDSEIVELPAPYFFEASELNYINGYWIYTYSTNWKERAVWPYDDIEKPTICCMSYMTSQTPLIKDSWVYRDNCFKNPGDFNMPWGNNHTHLHKYNGEYYFFYHTMSLQNLREPHNGFRSIQVEKIKVDEATATIHRTDGTLKGPDQIKPLNPFIRQQAETTSATLGIRFEPTATPGNMIAISSAQGQCIEVRGVDFDRTPKKFEATVQGKGEIQVRLDGKDGEVIAVLKIDKKKLSTASTKIKTKISGTHNLFFVFGDGQVKVDDWKFNK